MKCLQVENHSSVRAYESLAPDFVFPMAKENRHQEFLEKQSYPSSQSSHHYPRLRVSPRDHSAHVAVHPQDAYPSLYVANRPADVMDHSGDSTDHSGHIADHSAEDKGRHSEHVAANSTHVRLPSYAESKGESSGSEDKHHALVPHETSNKLGGVLEALQQARLSLQHKLNRLPLIEGGSVGKAIEPSFPSTRSWDRVEIPVGCTGLFRVPTDFQPGTATEANYLSSNSRSGLKNYHPDTGFVADSGDGFRASPYLETGIPSDGRFLTSSYRDTGSRIPSPRLPFDYYLDAGLSASTRYTYPAYSSHPDLQSRMPFNEGFPRSLSSREAGMPSNEGFPRPPQNREIGMPPTNHFSFYDDHIRPNMYR